MSSFLANFEKKFSLKWKKTHFTKLLKNSRYFKKDIEPNMD